MPDDEILTVEEAAAMLKVHPVSVRRYIRDGQIKSVKMGKRWRILRSEIIKALKPTE